MPIHPLVSDPFLIADLALELESNPIYKIALIPIDIVIETNRFVSAF